HSHRPPRRHPRARSEPRARGPLLHDVSRRSRRRGGEDRAARRRRRYPRLGSAVCRRRERLFSLRRRLAQRADVLIENFRPGAMDEFGLGYDALHAANPKLIYASLSGFGADGPMAQVPGYDLIVQAWGGLMSITGTPQSGPLKVGVAIIDLVAGLMLGKSIVAALYAREKN